MPQKKIFLADDSVTIQKVVELTFSEEDYEVHSVASGAQALRMIKEIMPDIVLLDITMPERSGYDICADINKTPELSRIPVLLLSGALEPFDERRAREAGARGHLTKPFESRALVSRVEELLGGHRAPTAPAAGPRQAPPVVAKAPAQPDRAGRDGGASTGRREPQRGPAAARQRQMVPPPAQREPSRVPPETLDRAVREAIQGISESVIREVAWQVIPDLAEAIIRQRIRELEEGAVARQ